MSGHPVDDPFFGAHIVAGMDDPDRWAPPVFDNMHSPPTNFSYERPEARLRSDDIDVPPLVSSQISDVPLRRLPLVLARQETKDCMVYGSTWGGHWDSAFMRSYVPISELSKWWTRCSVEQILWDSLATSTSGAPGTDFRRVFAILFQIGRPLLIVNFVNDNLDDVSLPISPLIMPGGKWQVQSATSPGVPRVPFHRWPEKYISSFVEKQWFLAPLRFRETPSGELAPFFDLPDDTILPFTAVDHFHTGGFSTVFRVQVHPDHHNLSWCRKGSACDMEASRRSDDKNPVPLAIKQLHNNDTHVFRSELQALQLLNRKPHPHIIPLLGSYRLHDKYNFVFPWADGDLAMFWRLNPSPKRDHATATWLAKQMKGLTDALCHIHGTADTARDGARGDNDETWVGRHGDIKPSNILFFPSQDHSPGTLRIADFGLSSFRTCTSGAETSLVDGSRLRYTPAYKAPEIESRPEGIGRETDVWSLGCLVLEFLTWHMTGSAGLEQLAACRMDAADQSVSTGDAFFELIEESGRNVARLKSKILDWTSHLQRHRHSSRFTDDVLQLVLDGLLVMDSSRRSSARDALAALTCICHELDSDVLYAASREARGLTFDSDEAWYRAAWGQTTLSDEEHEQTAPYLSAPLPNPANEALTVSASQVHSSTRSGGYLVNKRKRRAGGDSSGDATSSDYTAAAANKRPCDRRLACPFMKVGVHPSELTRACKGPGYDSNFRVKEHIQRCHTPASFKNPLGCHRCLREFESANLLYKHSREEPQCLIRAPEIINGQLSLEQALSLRSMKKRRTDMTEEDKWFEIFRILFPSKDLPASPYHEDATTVSSLDTLSTQSSMGITEYKDHLRRPMSDDDQRSFDEQLRAIGISSPDLCKKLAAVFRQQQLKDVQKFDRRGRLAEPVYNYGAAALFDTDINGCGTLAPAGAQGGAAFLDVQVGAGSDRNTREANEGGIGGDLEWLMNMEEMAGPGDSSAGFDAARLRV
ncbi:kinase-like domain-containing protein [Cercophora scortea]|uniref:Kinase-like domain-containing protein n=1 Tax=Cercophora scortea TaxID=314031 RepID=A0AAE0IA46_9PEZI|nr:kinase-like domain-containing protein [Cercophora scortea]